MKTHGKYGTRVYRAHQAMMGRCYSKTHVQYPDYGGRGIEVDPEWHDFRNFYRDMGDPPPGLSLERRENDKGYSRDNCYWATNTEQNRNRRNVRLYEFEGRSLPLSVWAKEKGIAWETMKTRQKLGWSIERMLTTDPKTYRRAA